MPKTPEEWLAVTTPPEKTKGVLKLFLGYAPGVGKTYSMLSEAIRRHSRGEDVVIGVVETHGRKGIAELVPQLEAVPRKKIEYKGTLFEEMDVDAIIARRPQVVLVDELAHTNIPGSKHRKRYEDVLELLDAKIDVLSTVNIQHIESIAPTVNAITGIVVRETVPDWVLQLSDETVMVDLTPEALHNRMKRGDVYNQEKVEQSLRNFFRRGNLIASARAGAAAGGGAGGSQPFVLHGRKGNSGELGRPRADRRLHQRESARAISAGARGPHGAADGCGALRRARGSWQAAWTRATKKLSPPTCNSPKAWARRPCA